MESFISKGDWWVPGEKRKRIATGTLAYSPESGGTLEVFGKRLDDNSPYVPVVHGQTEQGLITLFNCTFEHASNADLSEKYSQSFSCNSVIKGGHVQRNTLYSSADLRVSHLDDWARMGSIKELGKARKLIPGAGMGFYYERENPLSAVTSDGSKVTLRAATSGNVTFNTRTLCVRHSWGVAPVRSKSLANLIDEYVRPLIDLMTLLVDWPSDVIELKVARRSREGRAAAMPWDYLEVGLRSGVYGGSEDGYIDPSTYLIPRSSFDFGKCIPLWFDLASRVRGIRGLAFGLRYDSQMSAESKFTNAAMAAEGLHRSTFTSTRARVNLKNKATEKWISQFPVDERALVKTRLNQYINNPSLADRLAGLVDKTGEAFRVLVPQSDKWVKLVKDTRNGLAHRKDSPKVDISSGDMSVLTDSLTMLIYLCFLVDIGFEPHNLAQKIQQPIRIRVLQEELRLALPAS